MITVYTQPNCVQCDGTKIFLNRHNLEFTSIDISADKEAYDKVMDMGFEKTPVVITAHDKWSGFRIEKLTALAKIGEK